MAATVEQASSAHASGESTSPARLACLLLAPLSGAAAVAAAVDGWDGGLGGRLAWVALTVAWGAAGTVLLVRQRHRRLGLLVGWFSLLAGVASLAAAIAHDRPGDDTAALVQALAFALLPAAGMHVVLALPAGALASRALALAVGAGYLIAAGVGLLLWANRPSPPGWPLVVEAAIAAGVAVNWATSQCRRTRGEGRRLMHWVASGMAVGVEIVLVASTLRVLAGWPEVLVIATVAAVPIPLTLLLDTSRRLQGFADRLLFRAVSVVGLTALVVAIYILVVLGLGRKPTHGERMLLVLSILAAGISSLLYVPARTRLAGFASRLAYGARQAPDDVLRSFGARLSRAIPLEELLLQLAESLRSVLELQVAEIWTGSGGMLERVVSDPDRGPASLRLTSSEESVVARSRVSGPTRLGVWLPRLLAGRGDALVHATPITHAGELLGLIVVERAAESEPFDEEVEEVFVELARRAGVALHNVRLDSQLQASLDELRRQADELKASRARVVSAADAERRRIERDLHDGAQQYLVGVAVNLAVARHLADTDLEQAKVILDELRETVQGAMEEFRNLSHGIYPPLLQDRGLAEALANAARRASIPTRVDADGARRYDPTVEATVYFCCLEALQNAAKYAGEGARATVRVWEDEGGLLFEVADDGSGFDPARGGLGAGLTNMQDRVGAIGGNLRIESAPGGGTRVVGAIPLER